MSQQKEDSVLLQVTGAHSQGMGKNWTRTNGTTAHRAGAERESARIFLRALWA